VSVQRVPVFCLPARTRSPAADNTQGPREPDGRAHGGDAVDDPPHLPLALGLFGALHVAQVAPVEALPLPSGLPGAGDLPPHPCGPSAHDVPHAGRDKHQIVYIPEHGAACEPVRDIAQPDAGAPALHGQRHHPVDEHMRPQQRDEGIPEPGLHAWLGPGLEQVSLCSGLRAVEPCAPSGTDTAEGDAGYDVGEDGDGQDDMFQGRGLVDRSREQKVWFAGGDGAGCERDERGVGKV